ncbi:MAG: DinB family protein [Lunatimonas sp.]|uniref:DinB family protein n=1 Tax=Lunatimonas sp. TaxID=2060141 RepID=UPI00263BD4DD|nr:DinB family protein [Lunatimonas sp.]MCC5937029.1 DinB family protein [Lunatimonas sp.]
MPELIKPNPGEYNPFYQGYMDQMEGFSIQERLSIQSFLLMEVLDSLEADRVDQPMAEGKWTFNQAIGHLLDTEKIMHYRILAITREPGIALRGFDQDLYVDRGNFVGLEVFQANLNAISLNRNLLRFFLDGMQDDQVLLSGTVDGHPMSVRALYYIICGHMQHHLLLFRKYLQKDV